MRSAVLANSLHRKARLESRSLIFRQTMRSASSALGWDFYPEILCPKRWTYSCPLVKISHTTTRTTRLIFILLSHVALRVSVDLSPSSPVLLSNSVVPRLTNNVTTQTTSVHRMRHPSRRALVPIRDPQNAVRTKATFTSKSTTSLVTASSTEVPERVVARSAVKSHRRAANSDEATVFNDILK